LVKFKVKRRKEPEKIEEKPIFKPLVEPKKKETEQFVGKRSITTKKRDKT